MPRLRRRERHCRGWCHDHFFHLVVGHDYFGAGFGSGDEYDEEAARQCWDDCFGQVYALAAERHPGSLPWAHYQFGARESE